MAAGLLALPGPKERFDMVYKAQRHRHEPVVSKHPVEGNRGLDQMARAVEFVTVIQVSPHL